MKKLLLGLLGAMTLLPNPTEAQEKNPDKTLSPYFLVKSKDKGTDQMPLKHTAAEVNIAGVIADVKVTQVYENEGKNTLEAIYVFPGSTRAAVYAMTMTIGDRKLVAKVEERQKARADYEQAKEEGKTASLLEQQNPNVFQMNVANILPKDKITVELHYTELLVPTEGVYEFVYPTVVGPRYSETPAENAPTNEQWVANPYLKEGKKAPYTFDLMTALNAGMPIQDITCTSHKVNINYAGKSNARIALAGSETDGGNRDYILKYRLSGGQIQSGLLLYEGENATAMADDRFIENNESEKFFLLMMQPPKAPTLEQIPPREYVFIVDVSGSMHGTPLAISKELLKNLISKLRPTDRFNVMLFESSNQMLSAESMEANASNIKLACEVIDQQRGSGGTRLMPALEKALAFKETRGFSRSFVVVTDGYVTVEREAFDLIRNNLNQANLFAFGIGSAVNRFLIEGMAHVGQGEPFFLTDYGQADQVGVKFRQYIQTPVLTNIKINYEGFQVYDIEPVSVPDVFAERPIIIYGKYKGNPSGKITLSGLSGTQTYAQTINVSDANTKNNQAIRYLWARNKIRMLDDYNKLSVSYYAGYSAEQINNMITSNPTNAERIKQVTELGLKYNLLTAYTSFIAIDSEIRNKNGKSETVNQPLPLPKGVSNHAVGITSKDVSRSYINRSPKTKVKKDYHSGTGTPKKMEIAEKYNTNIAGDPTMDVDEVIIEDKPITVTEEIKQEEPILILEQQPEYQGGMQALMSFLTANMRYPEKAKQDKVEGKVMISFTVEVDGTISNIKVVKGLSAECDAEAIRVITLTSGKWKAGKQNGKAVKSTLNFPVVFKSK